MNNSAFVSLIGRVWGDGHDRKPQAFSPAFPWLWWTDTSIFYHSCSQSSQWIHLRLIITEYYKALTLKEIASVWKLAPVICSNGEQLFISLRCCPTCPPLQLLIMSRQSAWISSRKCHSGFFFFFFSICRQLQLKCPGKWRFCRTTKSEFLWFRCHLTSHPCWSLPSGNWLLASPWTAINDSSISLKAAPNFLGLDFWG